MDVLAVCLVLLVAVPFCMAAICELLCALTGGD